MKTKPYQLLIFDWDGTLMDSMAHIVDCMERAIAQTALEPRTAAQIRSIIGLGLEQAVRQLYPQADGALVQQVVEAYRAQFLVHNRQVSPLFLGAQAVIADLAEQGYRLAIATGKSRRGLDLALGDSGLGAYFPVTRCADETFSKPHPLMLEEILTDYNLAADAALMIGDTDYDLHMAAALRMDALAVSYGVHPPERLLAAQPLGMLADIRELPDWLQSRTQ